MLETGEAGTKSELVGQMGTPLSSNLACTLRHQECVMWRKSHKETDNGGGSGGGNCEIIFCFGA